MITIIILSSAFFIELLAVLVTLGFYRLVMRADEGNEKMQQQQPYFCS